RATPSPELHSAEPEVELCTCPLVCLHKGNSISLIRRDQLRPSLPAVVGFPEGQFSARARGGKQDVWLMRRSIDRAQPVGECSGCPTRTSINRAVVAVLPDEINSAFLT